MAKHLVIAGHGMQRNKTFDPGATGLITKGEHRYVSDDLFPAMKKFLPKNHNVVFFDKYKVSNYGNIVALAKQYNATQITEIHYDAASASASGGHVIIYSGYSPDKTDLALRDVIKKKVGVRYSHKGHEGISGRNNLFNVNQTANAGITYRLLELGFGTNKNDAKVLTENVEEYAKELIKVIAGSSNDKKASKQSGGTTTVKPSKPKVKPTTTNNASKANLTVDGKWGKSTTRALQKVLNTPVDGFISKQPRNSVSQSLYGGTVQFGSGSSNVIVALQRKVGANADGKLGPATVRALQKYLGTVQDGVLSRPSLVVKELQRRLNAGTF